MASIVEVLARHDALNAVNEQRAAILQEQLSKRFGLPALVTVGVHPTHPLLHVALVGATPKQLQEVRSVLECTPCPVHFGDHSLLSHVGEISSEPGGVVT